MPHGPIGTAIENQYTAGVNQFTNPTLLLCGAIVEMVPYNISDPTNSGPIARNWGIFHPPTACVCTENLTAANPIPIPIDPSAPGWYYFYTYIRLSPTDGSLVAESAPSPIMASSFNPQDLCAHNVTVTLPRDLQVTHIRFYRTTGEVTGFEDGTAPATAGYIIDIAVGSLTSGALTDTVVFDYTQPANILRLIPTAGNFFPVGCWAYGEYFPADPTTGVDAFKVQGQYVCRYKEQFIVYGYDNFVYWTPQAIEDAFKTQFCGYLKFPDVVTAMFVYKNDIIVCTATQTYRVLQGDWDTPGNLTLVVDGIGVIANDSCCFDATSNRTMALTNKGIRAYNGIAWSEDLSYQIKSQLEAVTTGVNVTGAYLATAQIINREYIISFRGSYFGSSDATTLVGFLNSTNTMGYLAGTVAWSIDSTIRTSWIMANFMITPVYPSETRVSNGQEGLAFMSVNGTIKLVYYGIASDYDFGTDRIVAILRLPRLIHGSLDNNIRPRYLKVVANLASPYTTVGEVPQLVLKATGDNGRTYEKVVITQDILDGPLDKYRYNGSI